MCIYNSFLYIYIYIYIRKYLYYKRYMLLLKEDKIIIYIIRL